MCNSAVIVSRMCLRAGIQSQTFIGSLSRRPTGAMSWLAGENLVLVPRNGGTPRVEGGCRGV